MNCRHLLIASRVAAPHLPDAVHAFVWRHWPLASPNDWPAVLGTTADNVTELRFNGSPRRFASPRSRSGALTLFVAIGIFAGTINHAVWVITPKELAFRLRVRRCACRSSLAHKPRCERLDTNSPITGARQRASEIKNLVQREFGDSLTTSRTAIRLLPLSVYSRIPTRHSQACLHVALAIDLFLLCHVWRFAGRS